MAVAGVFRGEVIECALGVSWGEGVEGLRRARERVAEELVESFPGESCGALARTDPPTLSHESGWSYSSSDDRCKGVLCVLSSIASP